MRSSASVGCLRSSIPSIRAALSTDECACSEQTTTLRPVTCRAAISAARVDVDAVSSMCPCQPSGSPSSWRTQSTVRSSSSVDAGDACQRIATWFIVAASSSARMPGSDAVIAKYAKKRGCCQFVSAGTISSSRSRNTFANGSALLRRLERQLRRQLARLHLRQHRQLADAVEIASRPVDRGVPVLAEVRHGRFRRSFSTCAHVRVFSTSSFVSHPRRACATANST